MFPLIILTSKDSRSSISSQLPKIADILLDGPNTKNRSSSFRKNPFRLPTIIEEITWVLLLIPRLQVAVLCQKLWIPKKGSKYDCTSIIVLNARLTCKQIKIRILSLWKVLDKLKANGCVLMAIILRLILLLAETLMQSVTSTS